MEEQPDIHIISSTIQSYIKEIRELYAIPKRKLARQYEAVLEVAMGEQILFDWGSRNNKIKKMKLLSYILLHLYCHTVDINT